MKNHHDKNMQVLLQRGVLLEASHDDRALILEIVKRVLAKWGPTVEPLALAMDLTACHLNGCPLRLKDLLFSNDLDLNHDVFGVRVHLNRETGELRDHFLPRYNDLKPKAQQQ